MSRASCFLFDEHQKRFLKILEGLAFGHHGALNDWAEMSAISLSNALMPHDEEWHKREDRYLQIAKQYDRKQLDGFSEMTACVVESLELGFKDCLGQMYMTEELRSRWDSDVAFTPWNLALMTAKMSLGDNPIPEKGYLTIGEPACGTGVMIIAAAQHLKDLGINYQRTLHATLTDIRAPLAHMAYIQMSLLHVPAVVIHGDTLAMTEWSRWRTPAHILGFWEGKAGHMMAPMPMQDDAVSSTKMQEPQFAFNFGKETDEPEMDAEARKVATQTVSGHGHTRDCADHEPNTSRNKNKSVASRNNKTKPPKALARNRRKTAA